MAQNLLAVLGGGIVEYSTPIIRADDAGVTRGDGCFEGIRVLVDDAGRYGPAKLDRHLARFARSAELLDIRFDDAGWRDLVDVACAAWTSGEAALKLVLTRGPAGVDEPSGYLTINPVTADYGRQRSDGIRAVTLNRGMPKDAFADSPWLLGGVKTLSYAVNMAAQREAERRGADDAIMVTSDGYVLEAPTGSVVWLVDRADGPTLCTTPVGDTGILPGTTQQLLFDQAAAAGWQTSTALITVDELHAADAIWIISSVRGAVEVVDLDGKPRERNLKVNAEITALCGF